MRVGIATDHGWLVLKQELIGHSRDAGHELIDCGAHVLDPDVEYPDVVIPFAKSVAAGRAERGIAICGGGIGASICATTVPGVRAALIHDHFSARQGVDDKHTNMLCMGGRTVGPAVARDPVQTCLSSRFSTDERQPHRPAKVARVRDAVTFIRQSRSTP